MLPLSGGEQKFRRMNDMNMKKMLALLLTLVMVLSLAACGPKNNDNKTGDDASKTDVPEVQPVKIGMVTDVGGVNDQSFNQGAWEGLQDLASKNSNFEVHYLESATDADYASNIQNFLDEEYDLIICVGFMLADATREAAEANPEQNFAIVDDASIDLPNVACLMFSQEQASYLVGIVAGMMTETNNVGYVQGMVNPNMNLFGIGFISGVKSVNPEATVQQYNANNFGDPAVGSTAAVNMITNGADIIYHAAGGTGGGVINACQENGIYAIGVDSDQSHIAPETIITSAMKRVDVACQDISLAVLNNEFTGGVHQYSLENGGVGIAPTQDLLTQEVIDAVNDAMTKIAAGEVTVPTTVEECPDFTLAE